MDYCLLEDAFKENTGCKDNYSNDRAKKHERKKMKRRAECFKPVGTEESPAYEEFNSTDNLKNLSEAFTDAIPVNLSLIESINKNKNTTGKLPKYFLGNDDDMTEGFTSDFSQNAEVGFQKAGGPSEGVLPIPSVNDSWKPLTPSLENTAFFNALPTPGGTYPSWNRKIKLASDATQMYATLDASGSVSPSASPSASPSPSAVAAAASAASVAATSAPFVQENSDLQKKIDDLISRLNALEAGERSTKNNQQEIIAFVGTGVFMIFALHILKR